MKRGRIYAAAKNWLIPPGKSAGDVSALNTDRAEGIAWLIVAGLALELLLLWFSNRPTGEKVGQSLADFLIVLGVAGELAFAAVARTHGNVAEAEARKVTAEANARALEAQVALEKYKAPRKIEAEQEAAIVARLVPFNGIEVNIFNCTELPEPTRLCNQIVALLARAGWRLETATVIGAGAVEGVIVQTRYNDSAPESMNAANALVSALTEAGIGAAWRECRHSVPDGARLSVGISTERWDVPIRVDIGVKP